MKTDITPSDSVCPIFLEPQDPEQVAADLAEAEARAAAQAAREVARQEVLDRLGLSAAEVQLLLGA